MYSENQGYHHIQGGVSETMKNQAAEISTIRAENGRAIQTLSDMLGGLKGQIRGIQTQICSRESEGGTMDAPMNEEVVRMMSKLRELESILESVRSETFNYFGAIQTLQQGSN